MCLNRTTGWRRKNHSKNQPEARSQRTTRSSAVAGGELRGRRADALLRMSSAAQTKLKATDCRFLGLGTGTMVGAPALRLAWDWESSTMRPSWKIFRRPLPEQVKMQSGARS